MEIGGAEIIVTYLCRYLRDRGHNPSVHCLVRSGALGEELLRENIPVYVCSPDSSRVWSLFRQLATTRPEVVHCHNATATILGAPIARIVGVRRIISTRHGAVDPPYSYRREVKFSLASRFCDHVVGVSKATARNLQRAPFAARDAILTIHNGALPPPSASSDFSTLEKQGWTVITVGRLSPPKDPETLLRAMARVLSAVRDVRLWVVGDGPLRPQLERSAERQGISANVRFLGERRDVGRLLAQADLFCLSSRSEGLPLSQLEALAAGLPVVVTNAGGMPEAAPAEISCVVPVGDDAAFAEAILSFYKRRHLAPTWRTAARAYFAANFSAERMCAAYERLYLGLGVDQAQPE